MISDSPSKPEFAEWNSYSKFAYKIKTSGRYIWGQEERDFLETVRATIRDRDAWLDEGKILYRAQLGVDCQELKDEDGNMIGEDEVGYSATRMKPLADRAREGRANPTGIPVLYVANTIQTAISEIRPWVGAKISVAWCKVLRPLKTLDLTINHGKSSFAGAAFSQMLGGKSITAEQKEKAVWIDIDNAFSQPVTHSDDKAEYAPTQILAELFRSEGYDAIGYKSQFGGTEDSSGYNIAIFDPSAVEVVGCAPHQVKSISVSSSQTGNAWSKRTG